MAIDAVYFMLTFYPEFTSGTDGEFEGTTFVVHVVDDRTAKLIGPHTNEVINVEGGFECKRNCKL